MCVAVPVQVIEVFGVEAEVEYGGVRKRVNIAMVDDVAPGDYVLIHAGCGVKKLDQEEAEKTLRLLEEMTNV